MHQSNEKQPTISRPDSAVSSATGIIGLFGLLTTAAILSISNLAIGERVLACLAGLALPMILWAICMDKVHLSPSTGLDLSQSRPLADTLNETITKLIGLWFTFLVIACCYWLISLVTSSAATFFILSAKAFPLIFVLSIPYVFMVNRYMQQPKDGLWHMGKWVSGQWQLVDYEIVADYLRGWAIKAFFLVFMFSILEGPVVHITSTPAEAIFTNWVGFAVWCIHLMFFVDICFGTVGYLLTLRILDSHIRSANPYLAAWFAALICYPPFIIMGNNGPMDYRHNTQEWMLWLAGHDQMLLFWGIVLILLTAIYAWATVIFGIRFSNLTHRGIITNGPYRHFKHPAYLSKNLFWWFVYMPFLSTAGASEAAYNCALLLMVNIIYYTRAKTEEKHLMQDPVYRQYSAWIAENSLIRKLSNKLPHKPIRPAS